MGHSTSETIYIAAKVAGHEPRTARQKSLSPAKRPAQSTMSDTSGTSNDAPRRVRTGGALSSLKSFVGVNLIRGERTLFSTKIPGKVKSS